MHPNLLNRFLKYIQINTQSNDESTSFPSSAVQLSFAKQLVEDCKAIGLTDVIMDSHGYVMATLPSNTSKDTPVIGFIAHMDTVPDYPASPLNPQIIEHYDGTPICLNNEQNIYLDPKQFPVLDTLKGETLITTNGSTVLGGDDKCGIAEILTAMEYLIAHPEMPHGTIRIGFTPDEEIGRGADFFDIKAFGADFAYTIDGCALGELQCENFNAASATVTFTGVSVHPGSAKDKMKNSLSIACEYQSLLPPLEVPEHTQGYQGFYHLHGMEGSLEHTTLYYIIRDHDKHLFEKRKNTMRTLAEQLNQKYGTDTVTITLKDSYYNMKEKLDEVPHVLELAKAAFKKAGITPVLEPIRGGTDGARLSFMGLPCPNIFTGAYNCHGKYEFAVLKHMEKAVDAITAICELGAQ